MYINPFAFTLLLVVSLGFFAYSVHAKVKLMKLGRAENRTDEMEARKKMMFSIAILQEKVKAGSFGLNHALLFWSFLVLCLANGEFLINGVIPALSFEILPNFVFKPLMFIFDIVSGICLLAVIRGIIRRIKNPPYEGARTPEAFLIISVIGALMLAYFGYHAAEIALGELHATMPFTSIIVAMISGMPQHSIIAFGEFSWWAHAFLLLGLMNYLPYGKHMHILTAIPNCFFGSLKKVNTVPREEFTPENSYGVEKATDFTWKDLMDSFTCTECGRCQIACPATDTGKALVPRALIEQIKYNLVANKTELENGSPVRFPLVGDGPKSIKKDAIWDCLSCGACMQQCPVLIEHVPKIIKLRRHLVQMESDFPKELLSLFENIENRSNPWGMAPSDRAKWIGPLNVPIYDGSQEYLFHVGCAGSFDSRARQVTIALVKILNHAGVSYGVLGKDEMCCGDSLRRLGNEFVFEQIATKNIESFKALGVKKIITTCPHCFSTFANDYKQYGAELEIIHHSVFINALIVDGKIKLVKGKLAGKNLVYHDSCYLGRHNDIYDAPRQILTGVSGEAPREMEKNRENAYCCGAGGGRMWLEEMTAKRINVERTRQALHTAPHVITVACPYCLTMFEDGTKDLGVNNVPVKDIAEVVAGNME